MAIILFLISILTSTIGSICGIGGGVIIKPFLDSINIMSVSAVSFLSGCTVLAMAFVSVGKTLKTGLSGINRRITPALGIGSVFGGIFGKLIFGFIKSGAGSEELLGFSQSLVLALITLGTMLYMVLQGRGKIKTLNIKNIPASLGIGFFLGLLSSFLGIGGGPINLAVLSFFFSMNIKESAINSLCIILFSQIASLAQTILTKSVPEVDITFLAFMVAGGILGGYLGQSINKKLDEEKVLKLYNILLVIIVLICIYNCLRFAAAL